LACDTQSRDQVIMQSAIKAAQRPREEHLGSAVNSVFLENVAALRTRGLGKVLADLAALGYDTQWLCLRAADAGACHRRDRIFILAGLPAARAGLAAAAHPGRRGV